MVQFTRRAGTRIIAATKRVERMPQGGPPDRGRWRGQRRPIRRIELKSGETLTPGGTAAAYFLTWGGSSYSADTSLEITVQDAFSRFRQSSPPTGQNGARGYAIRCGDRDVWELIDLEHQALWIEFVVNNGSAGFATTDASTGVDGITYHNGYTPTTGITTVYNKSASSNYIFEGDDNDKGIAHYSLGTDKYIIQQMECP
jgi:hypothetical protein